MIVPGGPEDPIQLVDVRDLAAFIVRCIQRRTVGVFNVTGPERELSMRRFVEEIERGVRDVRQGGRAPVEPVWIDPAFLEAQGLGVQSFPLWLPASGESAGFHRRSIARALQHGLTFRPLADTARATLEWWRSLPDDTRRGVVASLPEGKEAAVIAAWRERG